MLLPAPHCAMSTTATAQSRAAAQHPQLSDPPRNSARQSQPAPAANLLAPLNSGPIIKHQITSILLEARVSHHPKTGYHGPLAPITYRSRKNQVQANVPASGVSLFGGISCQRARSAAQAPVKKKRFWSRPFNCWAQGCDQLMTKEPLLLIVDPTALEELIDN